MTNQPKEDIVEREPKIVRMLFNDDMARAIVSGRKTVTRRPIVPGTWNPNGQEYTGESMVRTNSDPRIGTQAYFRTHEAEWHGLKLPCLPGDILIGRECWRPHVEAGATWVTYRAGGPSMDVTFDKGPRGLGPLDKVGSLAYSVARRPADGTLADRGYTHWESSMVMPDWAARIRRRVVSVTVERVQDISESEAVREGFEADDALTRSSGNHVAMWGKSAQWRFARAWDSIYAAKGLGWALDPWVWRIEFERENAPTA